MLPVPPKATLITSYDFGLSSFTASVSLLPPLLPGVLSPISDRHPVPCLRFSFQWFSACSLPPSRRLRVCLVPLSPLLGSMLYCHSLQSFNNF